MKKLDVKTVNCNSEYENDDIRRSNYSPHNVELLTEMFPLVPEQLFYPLIDLNENEIGNLIIQLTSLNDEADIKNYLSTLSYQSENVLESTGICGVSDSSMDKFEISSNDDKVLADLEEENEKCLVLGRTFIKEAHKMFASQFGLENVNIDDIPPEITEMRWKVSEKLMLNLYKAFFEEIGFIDTNNDQKPISKPVNNTEKLTMKEIIELETALFESTEKQRKAISENEGLSLQLSSLQLKFPDISREELERLFISCDMDTSLTTARLYESGHHSSQKIDGNSSQKITKLPVSANNNKNNKDFTSNALRAERFQERIVIENNRIQHAQNKLNSMKRHDLHAQVAHYWYEELAGAKCRLAWYEERLALATEVQQSVIFDSRQLDLHGFTQQSAVAAVNQRIEKFRSCGVDLTKGNQLIIICGRGLNSLNGRPRLKPAIKQYLQNSGITFTECFEGTFRVPLRQFVTRK